MKLTELFTGKSNMENTAPVSGQQQARATADVNRQIRALAPGQTIRGEVIGRNGGEVQIKLAEDMILNARVDQNMNLELGKYLTFEVKSNGAALTLSPLFTNMAADVNVLKALDMAGLPVNETSVEMTKQLMEAGLSVNKSMLQQVYRELKAYPDAEISDIISLHRLQLPVNEANVNQMASYRNLNYQLTGAMDTILELAPQAAESMLQEGNAQAASALYRELFALIREGLTPSENAGESAARTAGEESAADDRQAAGQIGEDIRQTAQALTDRGSVVEELPVPGGARQEIAEQFARALTQLHLPPEEKQALAEQIRAFAQGAPASPETAGTLEAGGAAQLFELADKLLQASAQSGQEHILLRNLLGQNSFKELLSGQIKNLWTVKPEDVAEPEKLSELYRRLDRQLSSLSRALEAGGQAESGAYKAVANLSQNIDFMQQLNQMYAYVQLPLRLQQGDAHGDLYVYANRKGLTARDGQVSALLHLDMEHLGPVDVYVALQNTRVSTKFYVRDDEMLDFLEEHMELLTKRLEKRGYQCDVSMTTRGMENQKEGDKGLEPLLQQGGGILLSQYAFDVRT